jgi:type VI secretion system protein ImpK
MEEITAVSETSKSFGVEPTLLDCYMELIAYAGYILKQVKDGSPDYESVGKTFQALVDRSKQLAAAAGFSEAEWLEGFFPVCAYIDEALLCSEWSERSKWEQSQLQRQYFNTTSAGGEFYKRLNNLDDSAGNIQQVYEFCLTLGFKGQYFQASDIGRLEDIQYTHLKRVTENIDLVFPESLFPDAYESDIIAKQRKRKKWKRVSLFSPTAILLPVLLFVALYYLFDRFLNKMVGHYFGAGF